MNSVDRGIALGLVLVLCVLAAGCASGLRTQRFLAHGAGSSMRYDGFLAYAAFKDLSAEGRFEKALCQRLNQAGHACVPMLALATPTAPQDGASRQRAMRQSGAQAAVVIELADPDSASRRLLADGRIGYRVSVIDTKSQAVVARLAIENPRHANDLAARAHAVAQATVAALDSASLLRQRH